jgi:transposase
VVQSELGLDPHSGVVVVFRSRRADRIKVLVWDGTGLVLVYKRLEQGSFAWPPIREGVMKLSVAQFEALFASLDWRRVHTPKVLPPAAAVGGPPAGAAEPLGRGVRGGCGRRAGGRDLHRIPLT